MIITAINVIIITLFWGGAQSRPESIFGFFKGKSSSIVAQNDEMSLKKSILTASLSAY